VVDRVHEKGGFIYMQLWALGRAAEQKVLKKKGFELVSSGNIPVKDGGPAPEPLSNAEVYRYVQLYAQAAKNAVDGAGFDGVEIHNANGYLPDQFLQTNANNRTDEFGGSVENRSRFTLLIAKAVTDAIGQEKTGIRFSPYGHFLHMRMSDDLLHAQFTHVITSLRQQFPKFAYIHVVEPRIAGDRDAKPEDADGSLDFAREAWGNGEGSVFLSAGGYTLEKAKQAIDQFGGAVVFGRDFISNPDLPLRLKYNLPLNKYDRSTFYTAGPQATKGYTDYPFSSGPSSKL